MVEVVNEIASGTTSRGLVGQQSTYPSPVYKFGKEPTSAKLRGAATTNELVIGA